MTGATPPAAARFHLMRQFLRKVRLDSHHAELFYPDYLSPGWAVDVTLTWGHPQAFEVLIIVGITLRYPEEAPKPMDLSFELAGVFYGDRDLRHEEAESFALNEAPRVLWPYVQDAMSVLTTRGGGPPFVLPELTEGFVVA